MLRRLAPIPANAGVPTGRPHDVAGVSPSGAPVQVRILGSADPVLLLFLKADCLGCHDLWEGMGELRASLGESVRASVRVVVVTRGPLDEDAAAIAGLAALAADGAGVPTVMSTAAFTAYRVAGPPFLVVVDGERMLTEAVAWGLEETLRATRAALAALPPRA
jgi:hypothetical protein